MSRSQTRRGFVKSSAIMSAGVIIAPGITLHCTPKSAIAQNKPGKVRWGLLIDTNKCTPQCTACVQACNIEHGLGKGDRPKTDAQWIRKVELQHKNSNLIKSLPMLCQHCEDPPCVDVCPTNASFKIKLFLFISVKFKSNTFAFFLSRSKLNLVNLILLPFLSKSIDFSLE